MKHQTKTALGIVVGAIAIILGCLLVWHTIDVILLGFAAVLFAVILNYVSRVISNATKIPYSLVVVLVVITLLLLLTLIFWLAAPLITEQVNCLIEELPKTYNAFKDKLSGVIDLRNLTKENVAREFLLNHEKILTQATAIFSFTVGAITSFVIFGLLGIYLAFSPERYIYGFLQAFPASSQPGVSHFLSKAGHSLRWWILGKFVSMTIIGILTWVGLSTLKIPLAFILALLSALLAFIPYIGAILAAIPAILIGFSVSFLTGVYVVVVYLIVHAIDSYVVSPYVDQKTVAIPPALTIIAQLVFTLLFGFIGLALASPLVVVSVLFVQQLYHRRHSRKLNSIA